MRSGFGGATSAPVSPAGAYFSNLPAGWTTVCDTSWATLSPSPWVFDYSGWGEPDTSLIATTDVTAPYSGPTVVRGRFPGDLPPDSGGSSYFNTGFTFPTPFRRIYLGIVMKWSNPFNNSNGNGGTKLAWLCGDQTHGTANYLDTSSGGNGLGVHDSGLMRFQCNQQGIIDRIMSPNVAGNTLVANLEQYIGSWVHLELVKVANTNDATSDGLLDMWVNATHTHHYTDVQWQMDIANTGNRRWLDFRIEPTYGGGQANPPQEQYHYYDHIKMAGSNT